MLTPSALLPGLSPLFDQQTMPRASVQDAVTRWMQAYVPYAQSVLAGVMLPTAPLSSIVQEGDFLTSLDSTLRTMWMSVVWAGPGATGTTLFVPPIQPYFASAATQLSNSPSPQLGLQVLVAMLHSYTLAITVNLIPASGPPVIVPLT
jgi:hypothetical protein